MKTLVANYHLLEETTALISENYTKKIIFLCILTTFFLLPSFSSYAHKVNVFAEVDGGIINVDCYYSRGNKVHGGKIKVFDLSNNKLLFSGVTDGKGILAFKIPLETIKNKSGLKLILNAGMGHRGEWELPYTEISESLKAENDTSGIMLKQERTENKIKAEKAIENSTIKPFSIFIGLLTIWILFGGVYIFLRRKKRVVS